MENTIKLYNFDENTYSYVNQGICFSTYAGFALSNMISRGYNNAYDEIKEEKFSTMRNNSGSSNGGSFGGGGFSNDDGFSGGGSGGGGGGSW